MSSSPAPTKSVPENLKEKVGEMTEHLAEEMGIPTWGLVAIIVGKLIRFHNVIKRRVN